MKILLGAILILALIVIGFYIYKTRQEKKSIARTVGRTLFFGWIIVLFNFVSLVTRYEGVCLFAYSMYFVASDWMLYYLLRFSLEYIGNDFERFVKRRWMLLLLAVDSALVLFNNFYQIMYELRPVELYGGESYYELAVKPLFYVHYAIILMLVVFSLLALFYGTFTAPVFYRKKYLTIALITTALAIINIFTVTSAVDVSVIGYVVEAISLYYCAFVYTPQKLLQKMLFQVTQDMTVAVFVLDTDGKMLYSNTYADALLNPETAPKNTSDETLEEWCQARYLNEEEAFIEEQFFYRGDDEVILKIQLQRMVDDKNHLQGGYFVIQDRTEEINNLKQEQYLATHDSLTGLYNKEYFCEVAKRYLERYPETEFYVICTDIKEFKIINDSFGTQIGDQILRNAARMLKEELRGAVVTGRIGSDVFAILMPKGNYNELFFRNQKSKDFLHGIDKAFSFPVVSHVGIYEVTERELPVSVMCDRARMAINTIKEDYHKRIAYYDEKLRAEIVREQELIKDFDKALENGQIRMFLQPQTTVDGKLLGAEALVRWCHPEKGWISPGEFIPVFERNGLISDIDRFIWEEACKQLKAWKEMGRDDIYISVNISPRDFYFLNVYHSFIELVEKYDIEPKNLKLEITETAIVLDFNRQVELITRLRKNGFVVEMDDFGSGYSSLNMLKDIHVDILKIDMAFLKKAKDEERSKKILQMVVGLSSQLGMPVITEGVESAEQVQFLSEIGCEMFQGYYFAKPMSVEEFETKYFTTNQ